MERLNRKEHSPKVLVTIDDVQLLKVEVEASVAEATSV
jgi:hypothetical protein